jgi:phage tail-like protein
MDPRRILHYLPQNYRVAAASEPNILMAMLSVMDAMQAPSEAVLGSIDSYFDPYRAPDAFVLMQASWLGLDRYFEWSGGSYGYGEPSFPTGIGRLRLLIGEYPSLVRSRGTRFALTRFLEVATGISGFSVDDGSASGEDFHILVHAPKSALPFQNFVRMIVAGERPAHATWDVQFAEDHKEE